MASYAVHHVVACAALGGCADDQSAQLLCAVGGYRTHFAHNGASFTDSLLDLQRYGGLLIFAEVARITTIVWYFLALLVDRAIQVPQEGFEPPCPKRRIYSPLSQPIAQLRHVPL